ncbi:hypothetical protein KBD71_03935 [Candidatus Woesebacteria bacterium]|nr:hypothetical protein [Candidatus Woesebacteria bacterium]
MGSEYFSTIDEALKVFTDEQRASDFQVFVIAMSFFKKLDTTTITGSEQVISAVAGFQAFLKPIKTLEVDESTHAQIREKATALAELLQVN